jgi:excisionase family DNA binding protein
MEFLSIPEGAALLRISHWTLRQWLTANKLPRYKVGGRTLVSKESVMKLVTEEKPTQAAARNSAKERRRGR